MKISAYCTTRNAKEMEYPFIESITSHLAFADEVIVYDTSDGSDDTLDELNSLSEQHKNLKIYHDGSIDWKLPNKGVYDGQTKALARKKCTGDVLWQFDIDEIVHESQVSLIKVLAKSVNDQNDFSLLALPVIDYWGREGRARLDVTPWKWRLSKNDPDITHGIPGHLRKYVDGLLYAHHGTDGCDYIFESTGKVVPCAGFLPGDFDAFKAAACKNNSLIPQIQTYLNDVWSKLPTVHHYSWFNIERKIRNFRTFWNESWKSLYNENRDERNNPFFPGMTWNEITDDMIRDYAIRLETGTGGHVFHAPWDGSKNNWVFVGMGHPKIIEKWIGENK
jgi:hypothetical protein